VARPDHRPQISQGREPHLEVDAGVTQPDQQHGRFRVREDVLHRQGGFEELLRCEDVVVAVVDADEHGAAPGSPAGEVGQRLVEDVGVRHQRQRAVVGADRGHPQVDVLDEALQVIGDDHLAAVVGLTDQDQDAGQDVLQDVLERQGDPEPDQAERREYGPHLVPGDRQGEQHDDQQQHDPQQVADELADVEFDVGAPHPALHAADDQADHEQQEEEDHDREDDQRQADEEVAEELRDRLEDQGPDRLRIGQLGELELIHLAQDRGRFVFLDLLRERVVHREVLEVLCVHPYLPETDRGDPDGDRVPPRWERRPFDGSDGRVRNRAPLAVGHLGVR